MFAMKRGYAASFFFVICTFVAVLAGCSTLDERQRASIFQPSDRTWGGGVAAAEGMDDIWISFRPQPGKDVVRLHGLWLEADPPAGARLLSRRGDRAADYALATRKTLALNNPLAAPVLLYLHGARYNVTGSAPRMRRMQDPGFSVLAIDYRGFGQSTAGLLSEKSTYEDARAAWDWLALKYPDRPRYIFGHSLGGSIAIDLAANVADEKGTIVEGTFTSIADVVGSSDWGWVPLSILITQRFEAVSKVAKIGSPLLVVHGDSDRLILPDLGRKLFDAALGTLCITLAELWYADRDGPQGVFLQPIASLLARKTTQQTARARATTDRRELCRGSLEPKRFLLVKDGSHHNTNLIGQAQYRTALNEPMAIQAIQPFGADSAAAVHAKSEPHGKSSDAVQIK